MIETITKRGELRNIAFQTVLRPALEQSERLGLVEAQTLINTFNKQNHSDIRVLDMFGCTVKPENGQMVAIASRKVVLDAARLCIEDCNASLINPNYRSEQSVLKMTRHLAQLAIRAWS